MYFDVFIINMSEVALDNCQAFAYTKGNITSVEV